MSLNNIFSKDYQDNELENYIKCKKTDYLSDITTVAIPLPTPSAIKKVKIHIISDEKYLEPILENCHKISSIFYKKLENEINLNKTKAVYMSKKNMKNKGLDSSYYAQNLVDNIILAKIISLSLQNLKSKKSKISYYLFSILVVILNFIFNNNYINRNSLISVISIILVFISSISIYYLSLLFGNDIISIILSSMSVIVTLVICVYYFSISTIEAKDGKNKNLLIQRYKKLLNKKNKDHGPKFIIENIRGAVIVKKGK